MNFPLYLIVTKFIQTLKAPKASNMYFGPQIEIPLVQRAQRFVYVNVVCVHVGYTFVTVHANCEGLSRSVNIVLFYSYFSVFEHVIAGCDFNNICTSRMNWNPLGG